MSTQLLNGRILPRAVLSTCAAFALTVPSLWADAPGQAADQTALTAISAHATILTASAKDLGIAVANAIVANPGLTPADLAASALQPYPFGSPSAKVRGDRNSPAGSAVAVATAAIGQLVTSGDVTFDADAAAITDNVLAVNAGVSNQDLTKPGQTAVLKAVLSTISSDGLTNAALLSADESIGNALATDAYLEGLTGDQLTDVLQGAIGGVTGLKGKAPAVAPEAAEDFVEGILLSGTVPNAATYPAFAVAILKDVAANTSVDELVSYQVGLAQIAAAPGQAQANMVALATALFTKYATATEALKITQGLTGALPAVNTTEATRVAFVQALTSAVVKQATAIAEGSTFTDPYFSSEFVGTVLTTAHGATTTGAFNKDVTGIATGVGEILGSDGDELTQVAEVYSELTGSGDILASNAATIVKDLIGGAIKGLPKTIPASVFSSVGEGGLLMSSATHPVATAATLLDLEGIEDLMATGVVTADLAADGGSITTKAQATALAGQLGLLAKDIALFVKGQTVNGTLVGESLAGTLAQYVSTLGLDITVGSGKGAYNAQTLILAAIQAGVDAANPTSAEKALIETAISEAGTGDFQIYGAVSTPESAVTDL